MKIVIDIPEKEFGIDINDGFQDFFSRLKAEIKGHLVNKTNLVCGAYELETIDMFLKAFNNGAPLPKGHGRLIDADKLLCSDGIIADSRKCHYIPMIDVYKAPTIIEADTESEEEE